MLWGLSLVHGRDLPARSTDTTRSCASNAVLSRSRAVSVDGITARFERR
jgi:hypothetical protein